MTGKIFLLLSFVFISQFSVAQKEDRNWVFGDSIGIDFNNLNSPILFSTTCSNAEANACYSDMTSGQLKLYFSSYIFSGYDDYGKIYNSQNQIINNGDSLKLNNSMSNGAVFIPMPSDSSLLYFFSIGLNLSTQSNYLSYSTIDKNYNGGEGKILTKNFILIDSITEHLVLVKHGNGRDWWLITKLMNTNIFVKYLIGINGISAPIFQTIGSASFRPEGENSSSRNGDKLCFVSLYGNIDVFNFNRCSGELTNWLELGDSPYDQPDPQGWGYYGCEFSMDGNRLYISRQKGSFPYHSNIIQYSLDNVNPINTKTDVLADRTGFILGRLQLAPNNKIYTIGQPGPGFLDSSYQYLSVINSPDDSSIACDFNLFSYYLGGNYGIYGLPNMPNYNLGKLVGSPCDTLTSIQNENLKTKSLIRIFPNPATEQLTIDNGQFTIAEIEITDVMGRIIYKEQSHAHLSIIHCQLFSAGIYFVKVYKYDGSVEVRKFVKE